MSRPLVLHNQPLHVRRADEAGVARMKAAVSMRPGGAETIEIRSVDVPRPGATQVRLAVTAAGVSFSDALFMSGGYQVRRPHPLVPGFEVAGVVDECGSRAHGITPGSRVLAYLPEGGGFAQSAVADQSLVFPIPNEIDDVVAAASLLSCGTSLYALTTKARLRRGEWLVVTGATGSVGRSALAVGRSIGAHTIAVVSPGSGGRALGLGADIVTDLGGDALAQQIKDQTGCGAGVVFDGVGLDGRTLCRLVRPGGRILIVGFASGERTQLPSNILLVKSLAVHGISIAGALVQHPATARRLVSRLFSLLSRPEFAPEVAARFTLDEAGDAVAAVQARLLPGKVVLTT